MQKEKVKKEIYAYLLVIIGSALFAIGDVMFVNPYRLAPGGVYGLANVFNTVWPWKISSYAICMDIPLLIIGTCFLGPRFGIKTIVSIFAIFGFTDLIESTWGYAPVVHIGEILTTAPVANIENFMEVPHGGAWFVPDFVVNTLLAGIIYGVAIGLIFKSGATSGGSDIISMIIHKYTKISLGTLVLIVDGLITLSTLVAFKEFRFPVYSIIVIAIESWLIDVIVEGRKTDKTVLIVTDEYEKMRQYIVADLKRGGTAIAGTGLYEGAQRTMIYTTLTRADYAKLKSNMHSIDPAAFVTVLSSNEVMGLGFKELPKE